MRNFFKKLMGDDSPQDSRRQTSAGNLEVATAALLVEIASFDNEFSDVERDTIVASLKGHFGLTDDQVEEILLMTREELEKRIDLYYFTNQINDYLDVSQKMEIMEMIWRVIYADRHLNGHEDFLVHRFAKLLRLDHSRMIEAKLRVKRNLSS